MPLHKALFIESNPSPVKYAASLLNLSSDEVRLPLIKVTDKTKEEVEKENLKKEMMICEPDQVTAPELPQAPKQNARAYFSDYILGPANSSYGLPYHDCSRADYVGEGNGFFCVINITREII